MLLRPYMLALLLLFYGHAIRELTMGVLATVNHFIDLITIVAIFVLVSACFRRYCVI